LVARPARRPPAIVAKMFVPSDRYGQAHWSAPPSGDGRLSGAAREHRVTLGADSIAQRSFGGRSPEKMAAMMMRRMFTFIAAR
jgi:hypothetical protein